MDLGEFIHYWSSGNTESLYVPAQLAEQFLVQQQGRITIKGHVVQLQFQTLIGDRVVKFDLPTWSLGPNTPRPGSS